MGIVIPVTGGMDSAYLLHKAKDEGYNIWPLIYDDGYGNVSLRSKTIGPAIDVVRRAGLEQRLEVIPFSPTNYHKIEDGKYGFTPGRNMALAMSALAYAHFRGAKYVWLGFNAGNEAYYPDQSQDMFDNLSSLYNTTYDTSLKIELPISQMTRQDVVREGAKLGVDFSKTISCVQTFMPINCGTCSRCIDRKLAFHYAGVPDLTQYLGGANVS